MKLYSLQEDQHYIWERTQDGLQVKDSKGAIIQGFLGHGNGVKIGEQRLLPGTIQRPVEAETNWKSGQLVCPECLTKMDNLAPGMCVFSYIDPALTPRDICTECGETLQKIGAGTIISLYRG